MKHGKLLATGTGNWNYFLREFSDGSAAVVCIAKEGSGASDCHFCAVKNLRAHFLRLSHICGYDTIIPPDWNIVDKTFFEKLGIL